MAIDPTTVRTFGAVRLERWPRDRSVGLIAQRDHDAVIDANDLERAITAARAAGYRRVRTSAVFDESADIARSLGARIIDTLVLLRRSLDDPAQISTDQTRGHREQHDVRRLWSIEDHRAAVIDRAAFGPLWGSDRRGLGAIRRATPHHVAGAVGRFGRPVGFVIAGIGLPHGSITPGFIQRLAVEPAMHRRGIADALLRAALRRLGDHRVTIVSVNTGIDNHAALGLYDAHHFTPTERLMYVGEIDLEPATGRR